MFFHITKLSTYAMQILQNSTNGSVHSVYRNTVNVVVNDHLLALQTVNSPFSPISLILLGKASPVLDPGLVRAGGGAGGGGGQCWAGGSGRRPGSREGGESVDRGCRH